MRADTDSALMRIVSQFLLVNLIAVGCAGQLGARHRKDVATTESHLEVMATTLVESYPRLELPITRTLAAEEKAEIDNACRQFDGPARQTCWQAMRTQAVYHRQTDHGAIQREEPSRALQQALNELPPNLEQLCRVYGAGEVTCLSTGSLLGHITEQALPFLIQDLKNIAGRLRPDERIAFQCLDGSWGGAGTGDQSSAAGSPLTGDLVHEMSSACLRGATAMAPGAGASHFSGLNSPKLCGAQFGNDPGRERIEQTIALMYDMRNRCEATLFDYFKSAVEGNDKPKPGEPEPKPKPESDDPDSTKPKPDPWSDPRPPHMREPPEPDPNAAMTVDIDVDPNDPEVEIVTVYDPDGKMVGQPYYRPRTIQWHSVRTTTFKDGTKWYWAWRVSEGGMQTSYGSWDPDGEGWQVDCVGDSCRRSSRGWVTNKETGKREWKIEQGQPMDCLDQACAACQRYMAALPDVLASCNAPVGPGQQVCGAFAEADSCCSNPNAIGPDPTLIIPDEGNMVCYGMDADVKQDRCKERCKAASSAAEAFCNEECAREPFVVKGPSLLDDICLRAYSEDCYSSRLPQIPVVPGSRPFGGPAPPYASDAVLLPDKREVAPVFVAEPSPVTPGSERGPR